MRSRCTAYISHLLLLELGLAISHNSNADFSIVLTVSRVRPSLEFGAEADALVLDISTEMRG
jgi:uncharacterized protein YerC